MNRRGFLGTAAAGVVACLVATFVRKPIRPVPIRWVDELAPLGGDPIYETRRWDLWRIGEYSGEWQDDGSMVWRKLS